MVETTAARQATGAIVQVKAAGTNADPAIEKKAAEWTASLQLTDASKAEKVKAAIVTHLTAVRDWHNTHPFTLTPAGINPATGNKLSEMDRQIIVCSTKPASIHDSLMMVLTTELDTAQVEAILDKYTVGKVAFTLKGYQAIVSDLTAPEEAVIVKNLKQAREQAIDYKGIKEVSAIFEIYKTKCEQYLNNNGRNWRQLFKAYIDKIKAQKEAEKNKQ
jgi:MinD superfamily P-loop ATPase